MDGTNQTSNNYVWRGLDMFARYGTAEAIVHGDRRMSYLDVHEAVLRLAATLRQRGLRSGMSVVVLVANPPEAIILQLAMHLLGCRTVWIAKAPRAHQTEFLRLARADAFIYQVAVHREAGRELARLVEPRPVWCLGPGGVGPDLLADEPTGTAPDRGEAVAEPESLFQTSGVTGRPKLVHHRHRLFQVLPMLAEQWVAQGRPVLHHLSIFGFWHVASQMTTLMVLFMGGRLVLQEAYDPATFLAAIERERLSSTVVSPPMLYELLDHPAMATTDTSSLRVVTCGGSAVAPARLRQAIERLGPVIRVVYAMSESPGITEQPGVTLDPEHPERLRSAGLPYADVKVQIRDTRGAVLPAGHAGEVWVRSALVMDGYWGEPELTRATLVDGWLRTGDIGQLDEDGYLYLMDRLSDMIITGPGSTNVHTRPIEDVLAAHPQVRAAAVIGVPDERMGEAVHAFVVPVPGATVTGDELRVHVIDALNEVWAPREVQFVEALPLVGMGKIDKAALRHRWQFAGSGVRG